MVTVAAAVVAVVVAAAAQRSVIRETKVVMVTVR